MKPKLVWSIPFVSRVYSKMNFWYSLPRKKFVFQSEISTFSLSIRLFYFQKYKNFVGSRSCPNRTIFGMAFPLCS